MDSFPKCWKISSKPHNFCPGCGHPIVLKALGWAIDELGIQNKTAFGIDIGCSLLAWDFFNLDTIQTHHGRTVPVMVGLKLAKPESVAIAYLGDGGAYAIGAQHLINTRVRNNPITIIIVNNANYGMTGGQEAPTTLPGQITSTTPQGADDHILKGIEMVASMLQDNAYIVRGTVDNPVQLKIFIRNALKWQMERKGLGIVEVLSYCPTNWQTDAKKTREFLEKIKKYYPLGEFVSEKKETNCQTIDKL